MKTESDWTKTFFSGFIVEAQRRIPQQTEAETAFLLEVLSPKPGDRILDVPCGNGRLANALAERGFAVTGVDGCGELLDDGRRVAKEQGLRTEFEQRDMRGLPWTDKFDHAFCFGNSFSYFGEEGNATFLKSVYRTLKPGGRFALETHFVAESLFGQLMPKRWYPFGDLYFLHDTSYDPTTAQLTSSYILIGGNQVEKKTAVYNVYTYRALLRLVEAVGFTAIEAYGSLNRDPFRLGAAGLWLVCRKPA